MGVFITSVEFSAFDYEPDHRRRMALASEQITSSPPAWLSKLLSDQSFNVQSADSIEQMALTRSKLSKSLMLSEACVFGLRDELRFIADRGFVTGQLDEFLQILGDVGGSIRIALLSSDLVASDGRVRSGAGKALPPGQMPAKYVCAAIVAEIWLFFHGTDPAATNLEACGAAELIWGHPKAKSRKSRSWGQNPAIGWKRYFQAAKCLELENVRKEVRRHLTIHAMRDAQTLMASESRTF